MRCDQVIEKLESLSPRCFAQEWDNVGLLAGRFEKEIRRVMIALDATEAVIGEAVREGADLLLTHHPLIFSPRKTVNNGDFIGKRLVTLLQSDICYYAMHTNFDVMGMGDAVADELGLLDRQVLEITYEDEIAKEGIGRVGRLQSPRTLTEYGEEIKRLFQLDEVRIFGGGERMIKRAAVCPGSGKGMIGKAIRLGADVLITGDIDHHSGIDAAAQGLAVIDAGHYGLEKIFLPYMEDFLKRECRELQILRAKERAPFRIL